MAIKLTELESDLLTTREVAASVSDAITHCTTLEDALAHMAANPLLVEFLGPTAAVLTGPPETSPDTALLDAIEQQTFTEARERALDGNERVAFRRHHVAFQVARRLARDNHAMVFEGLCAAYAMYSPPNGLVEQLLTMLDPDFLIAPERVH